MIVGQRVIGIVSLTDLARCAVSLLAPALDEWWAVWRGEGQAASQGDEDYTDQCFFAELWSDAQTKAADLLRAVSGSGGDILEVHTVADAMKRNVPSRTPETTALEAASLMTMERIQRIVVMEGDRLVGIVSLTDIARAATEHRLSTRPYAEPNEPELAECGAMCAA